MSTGGFRPVTSIGDSSYNGRVQTYSVASTHATLLAVGDLVIETGVADANGVAGVDAAAAGGLISGVIVAIAYNMSNLEQAGLPAGTAGTVMVAPATSDLLLTAYVNASGITVNDVSANADIVATAATLTGGLANSNMVINGASYGSATAQIRIVGLVDGATGASAKVYCRINESTVTGVVGV
jgi:hypothetical protein